MLKTDLPVPAPVSPTPDAGRRRPGRPDTVNPNLVPLLPTPVPAARRSHASPLARQSDRCQACHSPEQIFPFTIAFQPIVDVQESRIDAYEALVRGPNGEGAGQVLAQVNADNVYTFDQTCRVKAIEMAARLGIRAVQRCRLAVTESALQHLMSDVRQLIAKGIPEPANV